MALRGTVQAQSFHKVHLSKVLMFCSHARIVGDDPVPWALELMGNLEAPGPPAPCVTMAWEKGGPSPRMRACKIASRAWPQGSP